jgi:hypothetical protein
MCISVAPAGQVFANSLSLPLGKPSLNVAEDPVVTAVNGDVPREAAIALPPPNGHVRDGQHSPKEATSQKSLIVNLDFEGRG